MADPRESHAGPLMRLDYLSIFPDYFGPLALSLLGKAQQAGLIETHVHDLRDWAHDKHRTVDDTPYGGGAGMVMRPEPWGEAFDALGIEGATVVVLTPAGRPLSQPLARELATRRRLIFLCGRYEGIDQRVVEYAAEHAEVVEVSLGDYVLNGGEVAALAITEAVVRLLPGVVGNVDSLTEESHESGLLEHPSYTKPASWRGRAVPEVLLSGDHAAIAAWRAEQARARTVRTRPDLLHPSTAGSVDELRLAVPADAGELWTLQTACWVQEQVNNPGVELPTSAEGLADVAEWLQTWTVLVLRRHGRLIGAARGRLVERAGETVWDIGRLMAAPDLQGQGIGRRMLAEIEALAPAEATAYVLFTGAGSTRNQRIYKRAGYRPVPDPMPSIVALRKPRRIG
ncbi:MAG: tRNA (guanosine(37)-N1)-methyltransferase TrmD [Nocardioides sp.]